MTSRIPTDMVADRTSKAKLSDTLGSMQTSINTNTSSLADITSIEILLDQQFKIQSGETDDTSRIQRAINSIATTGGKIKFSNKTYNVVGLTIPAGQSNPITFEGLGDSSILQLNNNSNHIIILNGTGDTSATRVNDFKIRNMQLTVKSGVTGSGCNGIQANYAHRCKFESVTIGNMIGDGIQFTGTGYDNVISSCKIWQNAGVGVRDNSATGQITPLWITNGCRIEGNKSGGIEIKSPTFNLVQATVEGNTNWDLYAHYNAHGSVVGTHFEDIAAVKPLVLIGNTSETQVPDFAFIGCQFYGNNGGQTIAGQYGVHIVQAYITVFNGCHFSGLTTCLQFDSTAGHVMHTGCRFTGNINSTSGTPSSLTDWRDGSLQFLNAGLIRMYGGSLVLDSSSKITTEDVANNINFDSKNLASITNITASGNVSMFKAVFSQALATTVGVAGTAPTLPSQPSGYLPIQVGSTTYKIPVYAN